MLPANYDELAPHVYKRQSQGLRQCDIARRMGLHPSTVCNYEQGRVATVPAAWIERYAEAVADAAADKAAALEALKGALERLTPGQRARLTSVPGAMLRTVGRHGF